MSKRITEKILILPSLFLIFNNPGIGTSGLIAELTDFFKPTGEDAEILSNRHDTKFSQIVRNLVSHRDSNRMDVYTDINDGKYTLTENGHEYLKEHLPNIEYLFENGFDYDDASQFSDKISSATAERKVYVYDEKTMVSEGEGGKRESIVHKRSIALRNAALTNYTNNGRIFCKLCGFDLAETYGEIGQNFIEIHHLKSINQYSDEDFEKYIPEALKNLAPVCSNCHSMLHKRRPALTIDELKCLMDATKHSA
jgi:predicted HNH restriction endonuclease